MNFLRKHIYLFASRVFALCVCSISGMLSVGASEELLSWTRSSDGRSIEASLVSIQDDGKSIMIKLADGSKVEIETSVLILSDRERIQQLLSSKEDSSQREMQVALPRFETLAIGRSPHKIHIYEPDTKLQLSEKEKRPILFLFAHSGDTSGVLESFKPSADRFGWVLVGVDAYNGKDALQDYGEVMKNTKEVVEWGLENFVCDPEKMVLGGFAGGGWWSYHLAAELRNKASGIICLCSWMDGEYGKRYPRGMAISIVNGTADRESNNFLSSDVRFLEKKAKATVKSYSFDGAREMPPAKIVDESVAWIHRTKHF